MQAHKDALDHIGNRWTYWPHPTDNPMDPPAGTVWAQKHPRVPWVLVEETKHGNPRFRIDGYDWWLARKKKLRESS